MSGHSHARTIKHKKDAADAARSSVFSKMAREITVAVRDGGGDPVTNTQLRAVLERARSFNMPSANIDRAIARATGGEDARNLQGVLFEAYGPGDIALLISGITDNKNRTVSELKQILNRFGGKLVEGGAVQWMFEHKGVITINPKSDLPAGQAGIRNPKQKEEMELKAIESGADDMYWGDEETLEVYTKPAELERVKTKLQEQELAVESSALEWVPKENVEIAPDAKEAAEKLFEALDAHDDVQNIYSNLK
ncbi:MAG: YebC/PmpR family DNA-binding transcriptional regulator [Candidatus Wildermuthbacteria bacterium]|nr:YebC/PmpR family DNA-binding transcriptional regulator [Candidatus Wildermuthbacteria bacterium]